MIPPPSQTSQRDSQPPLEKRLLRDANVRVLLPLAAIGILIALAGLLGWGRPEPRIAGYAPIHSILEIGTIVVFAMVALISRSLIGERRSRSVMLIGAGFLGVAALDILHLLSAAGMPDLVTPSSTGKGMAFWLAARMLGTVALVMAAWSTWDRVIDDREARHWLVLSLGFAAGVSWGVLFHPAALPILYVDGLGQTRLKIIAELMIAAANLYAAAGFCRMAIRPPINATGTIDPLALCAVAVLSAISSILVAFQVAPDGLFDLLAHVFKAAAAGFLFFGVVSVNLDIAQTRTMLAVEAADLGLWTWDVASDNVELDGAAARIWATPFGLRPTMTDLGAKVHPDDRAKRMSALRTALDPRGDGTYACEFRILSADEPMARVVTANGKTLFRDGAPHRLVGIIRDVTERRRIDDDIRRSRERLNAIVSIAADAIISIDDRSRITMFNHGAEAIFGYGRDECLGQPLEMLLPQRYRQTHSGHVSTFGASSDQARRMAERREIFGLRKNGQEFPAEASISQITLAGEKTFTVVLRDNTERRTTERALAQLNQQLEARVAERTMALRDETDRRLEAQAALARAQRLEAFGRLAGGVAHDFNNLLTVITGNQELLEMRLKDEREKALLKRAQDAADMGARLTARLLTFAKRRQLAPQVVDLNEQITSLVELLQRSIGEDVTLTTTLAPRVWKVRCDPSEVENALLNLAINARDAMPNGGRLVIGTAECTVGPDEIGGDTKLAPGDYVRLSVSDTGTGMSPDIVARAFEPFFTTKPVGKGTGLGLSTIYGFVQQSGGTVTIHSAAGKGTTINCYLPRAVDDLPDAQTSVTTGDEPRARGETVLVVEDDAGVLDVTLQRVRALGYSVLQAVNAQQAIDLIGTQGAKIDLVLSDVVMPGGMSGFDLAHWVGANAPGIKVLLTSGYPDDTGARDIDDSTRRAIPMLRKPYGRSELARAMRRCLDARA